MSHWGALSLVGPDRRGCYDNASRRVTASSAAGVGLVPGGVGLARCLC